MPPSVAEELACLIAVGRDQLLVAACRLVAVSAIVTSSTNLRRSVMLGLLLEGFGRARMSHDLRLPWTALFLVLWRLAAAAMARSWRGWPTQRCDVGGTQAEPASTTPE